MAINYEFALESQGARLERTNRRMFIVVLVLVVALIGSNLAWLYYESQFSKTVKIEQEAESDNGNVILNGTGELHYGEGQTDSND